MTDTAKKSSLQGQRAIVTAGASGIGLAIARTLYAAGVRVQVCDNDAAAMAALSESDPQIDACMADVADEAQVDNLFDQALARLGGLDILINNAGVAGPTGPVESCEPQAWRRTLAINLDGQYLCARRAVPVMKRAGRGLIVNMSSSAGLLGFPLRAPYAASKWAVIGLTKTLAMELGPWGIRVNAICPGSVEGPRIDRVIAADAAARGVEAQQVRDSYLRQTSMRTFVSPEDIANMVRFLCSDDGRRISGQALSIDGHTESLGM